MNADFLQLRRAEITLRCGAWASHCGGFSCCGAWALGWAGFSSCGTLAQQLWLTGSRVQAQQLWRTRSVALQHVGSSRTRDQTRVPCIGRWILKHCATRGAWKIKFLILVYQSIHLTLKCNQISFQILAQFTEKYYLYSFEIPLLLETKVQIYYLDNSLGFLVIFIMCVCVSHW